MGLIYAVILIGALIFVHELGHFLVAKLFDVKVIRFSIGFGPKVVGFRRGETDYVICLLPLGGYVQMLGASLESVEDIPEEDRGRALMMKPIWQRSLVVLAGPFFNIVLPLLIYFGVAMTLTETLPAIVGDVFESTPASEAGLESGDVIVELDGEPIEYWYEVLDMILPAAGRKVDLSYLRDGVRHDISIVPASRMTTDFLGLDKRTFGQIGIQPGTHGTTVAVGDSGGLAARAGIQDFDMIVEVNGEKITRFDQWLARVRSHSGGDLRVKGLRRIAVGATYGQLFRQIPFEATIRGVDPSESGSLGLEPIEMFVSRVEAGAPAKAAGLQIGDKIRTLDGVTFTSWALMARHLRNHVNRVIATSLEEGAGPADVVALDVSLPLVYEREGTQFETTLKPLVVHIAEQDRYTIRTGWQHVSDLVDPAPVPFSFFKRLRYAATYSFEQTWSFSRVMLVGFLRMAQGRIGMDNLGGPIMIGDLAAQAGQAGWEKFLQMMALISINLGIINLLPIPLLDGGHLLLFFMEAVKRGPLSFRTRQIAAYVGFSLILFLMVMAFKNDIERNWDRIADYINES
jgi:regulator of sigma E protease